MIVETNNIHAYPVQENLSRMYDLKSSPLVAEMGSRLVSKCQYLGETGVAAVNEALKFAHEYHSQHSIPPEKAIRDDGISEYTTHLLAVADILADLRCDQMTLAAALLHDTLENTSVTKEMLVTRFGLEVANTVDTVTKVAGSTAETMVKVLNGLVDHPRAVLIKLADRLHNMRTINFLPKEKRRKIAKQTFQVFAPLARELGLNKMADELYDLSIGVLWEEQFQRAQRIIRKKYNPEKTAVFFEPIKSALMSGHDHDLSVSIDVLLPSIHDLFDFAEARAAIVDRDQIPVEIACRDENSFQETIAFFQQFYPEAKLDKEVMEGWLNLKFTIGERKFSIDIYNREGIAEKNASIATLFQVADPQDTDYNDRVKLAGKKLEKPALLLQQIPERGHNAVLRYFSEVIKYPLISVETPAGEIIVLPEGSTALDYAFSISHDLGLKARKAIINGKPAELWQKLNGGNKVEMIEESNWTVSVGMLDQVLYEGYKQVIRRALRLILKDNRECLKESGDRNKSYEKDLKIMHFTEDELRTAAEKIRSDAENRGEEKIKRFFEEQTGRPPIIDVNRGWEMLSSEPELKRLRQYKSLHRFLIECGLDYVEPDVISVYTQLLKKYEEALPTLSCVVPDERLMLAKLATIVGEKANIVGSALIYNIRDVPSGYVNIVLTVEADEETVEQLKIVLKGVAAEYRKEQINFDFV